MADESFNDFFNFNHHDGNIDGYEIQNPTLPAPWTDALFNLSTRADIQRSSNESLLGTRSTIRNNALVDNEDQRTAIQHPEATEFSLSTPRLVSAGKLSAGGQLRYQKDAVHIKQVYAVATLPAYPRTDPEGVLYICPIGVLDKDFQKRPWSDMQYSTEQKFPAKSGTTALLNDAPCMRYTRKCTGIKACPHLHPEIRNHHHTHIQDSEGLWAKAAELNRVRDKYSFIVEAIAFAQAAVKHFEKGNPCPRTLTEDSLREQDDPDSMLVECCLGVGQREGDDYPDGKVRVWVGCPNSLLEPHAHFVEEVPVRFEKHFHLISNIVYGSPLTRFLGDEPELDKVINEIGEYCGTMDIMASRSPKCSVFHTDQDTKLIHLDCNVVYRWWVPHDQEKYPWLFLTVHGTHTHPPGPPKKQPESLVRRLVQVIRKVGEPQVSLGAFMKSNALQQFLREFHKKTLSDIHPYFSNDDAMRWILRQDQAVHFPMGSSRLAVRYEWELNHRDSPKRYIQHFHDDNTNLMIIMFYTEQIELLKRAQFGSIQIDMNFKHLADPNEFEIIIGIYDYAGRRAEVIARVITNSQSPDMYLFMYEHLFSCMKSAAGYELKLKHIHGEGIIGITVDQEWANFKAWGYYLSRHVDPQRRGWQYHHRRSVRFCQIHYERNIRKLLGEDCEKHDNSIHNILVRLPMAQTQEDYNEICERLINEGQLRAEVPGLVNWVKHQRISDIASGIAHCCSEIDKDDWDSMSAHTNVVESLHEMSYRASGRYRPAFIVIQDNAELDARHIQQGDIYKRFNIRHNQANTSVAVRWGRSMKKRVTRKAQRLERRATTHAANDVSRSSPVADASVSTQGVIGVPATPRTPTPRRTQSPAPRSGSLSRRRGRLQQIERNAVQNAYTEASRIEDEALARRERELSIRERELAIKEREAKLDQDQWNRQQERQYLDQGQPNFDLIGLYPDQPDMLGSFE
ncbi:hypothetical protein F5Y06DRAFT_267543 [Hypoxylon sp. FL0890]|nr:hypothetical protein F5Y06DRAFT_267543 [Hypoxylon sp. FL0890]